MLAPGPASLEPRRSCRSPAPRGPRRSRWRAGPRAGAGRRGRRGRRWRRRSWPGRGRRACRRPRRRGRRRRGRGPRSARAGSRRRRPWGRRRARAARGRASRSGRRRGPRRRGSPRPGGGPSGIESSSASSWSRSETSQAAIVTSAPSSSSSALSSVAPSASAPLRLTRSRWRAPWRSTRWRATRAPRPPVAPVIRTVLSGSKDGARSPGSPRPAALGQPRHQRLALAQGELGLLGARGEGAVERLGEASLPSVSIRAKRPGCSDWAERSRPQSGAAGEVGALPRPALERPLGEEDEAGLGCLLVGEVGLDPLQGPGGERVGGLDRLLCLGPLAGVERGSASAARPPPAAASSAPARGA